MQALFDSILAFLPTGINWIALGKFLLILTAAFLVVGFIGKLIFGKGSAFNRGLTCAIGILFVYAMAVVIYTFKPGNLAAYLAPLPFAAFSGDRLYLFSFADAHFSVICHQLLSMIILNFLHNLIDDFMPRGKKLYWFIYRFLTIAMSLTLHYIVTWAFNRFMPGALLTYAPTVLLVVLLSFLLMGVLKVVLGVVLAVVNPLLGAAFAFFFGTKLGKQLSCAVMSTLILAVLVMVLHYFGYGNISVSEASLIAYIPLAGILLILWYIVGYKL